MTKTFSGFALALALAMFVALPAHACAYLMQGNTQPAGVHVLCGSLIPVDQTINLSTVYSGNSPTGAGPWLTARFYANSITDSSGTLTLTAGLGGADTVLGYSSTTDLAGWSFYLNRPYTSIQFVSGTQASVLSGYDFSTGTVPGAFNLGFGWSAGSGFGPGDTAIYNIGFATPFKGVAGNPIVANADGWLSAAYIQNIDAGSCSAWIVAGNGSGADGGSPCVSTAPTTPPTAPVPEPAGLGLLSLGLLLTGASRYWRRRRRAA